MIKDKDISSLCFKRKEKVMGASCREETFLEGLAQLLQLFSLWSHPWRLRDVVDKDTRLAEPSSAGKLCLGKHAKGEAWILLAKTCSTQAV